MRNQAQQETISPISGNIVNSAIKIRRKCFLIETFR